VQKDIAYNVTGQTFDWLCPEGRPDSVTSMDVYAMTTGDNGATESALSGSPSIDSVSTTVSGASGLAQTDRKKILLTATAGIVIGRTYLLTNATGEKEWVTISEIGSGYVRAKHDLRNDYASADTFKSTRIYDSFAAVWVQNANKISDDADPNPGYRVRLEYAVGSATYVHYGYFDLVRAQPTAAVTPADMDRFLVGWRDLLPMDDQEDGGQRLIDTAIDEVAMQFYAIGKADEMMRNAFVYAELVKRAAAVELWRAQVNAGAEADVRMSEAQQRFDEMLEKTIKTSTVAAFADDTGGAGERVPGTPILAQ